MSKKNTSGMKDMFEQAKQDIIQEANQEIRKKEKEMELYSSPSNQYDYNEDVEDRNAINGLENDIRNIEARRDEKLAELTIETVKQK
nr:hypothetical protein [Candidatus Enterousia merdequi]